METLYQNFQELAEENIESARTALQDYEGPAPTRRLIHHLVYPHLGTDRPVACSRRYDRAMIIASDFGPRAVVTMFVSGIEPCPICERTRR